MSLKFLMALGTFFFFLSAFSQAGQTTFKIKLINLSAHVAYCSVLGTDKTDSVIGGKAKVIEFELDQSFISFYLNVWSAGPGAQGFNNGLVRLLTKDQRTFTITTNNELKYSLNRNEKIVADYKPRLLSKNFWRLDSVVKKNAHNIAAAEIIYLSICDIDVNTDTIRKYYQMLGPVVKKTLHGQRIVDYLTSRSRLNLDAKVDNFSLTDSAGKVVALDEVNSEYVLLDFWFSNCVPCIKSFPDLLALYENTARAKLEIIGISIDRIRDNELWKSKIRDYKLPWINMNDAKNIVTTKYAIVNYPTRILIDRDRKIVMIDTNNSQDDFYEDVRKLVMK